MITDPLFYAAAIPALLITGIFCGVWLRKLIPEALFYRFRYGFLFVTGAKLLYDGVTRLI